MLNYKYDVLEIPFNAEEKLIIATDNSGSIGMKPLDEVSIDYETVSYYAFRVAYMECIAAGGDPFSVILHNFNDENVWNALIKGINKGCQEVGLENISITGSTETNFKLNQSAIGLVVLGRKRTQTDKKFNPQKAEIAIIGKPLVGKAVVDEASMIAPLSLYKELSKLPDLGLIYPISSKGIKDAVSKQINQTINYPKNLDVKASSGPATSFLIIYDAKISRLIQTKAKNYIQMVETLN